MKKCPNCAEEILKEAIKCRYCHSILGVGTRKAGVKNSQTKRKSEIARNIVLAIFVPLVLVVALLTSAQAKGGCDGSTGLTLDEKKKICLKLAPLEIIENKKDEKVGFWHTILQGISNPNGSRANDIPFVCDEIAEKCYLVSGDDRVPLDTKDYLNIRERIAAVGAKQEDIIEFGHSLGSPQTTRYLVTAGRGSVSATAAAINAEFRGALAAPGDAVEITILNPDGSTPRLRIEKSKLAFRLRKSYDQNFSVEILFVGALGKQGCEKNRPVCKTADLTVAAERMTDFLADKMTGGTDLFRSVQLAAAMKVDGERTVRLITEGEANFVVDTARIKGYPQFGKIGQDEYAGWLELYPGGDDYIDFMKPLVNEKINSVDQDRAVCLYTVNKEGITPEKDKWAAERDEVLKDRLCRNENVANW